MNIHSYIIFSEFMSKPNSLIATNIDSVCFFIVFLYGIIYSYFVTRIIPAQYKIVAMQGYGTYSV
jgi:hypothetical protein